MKIRTFLILLALLSGPPLQTVQALAPLSGMDKVQKSLDAQNASDYTPVASLLSAEPETGKQISVREDLAHLSRLITLLSEGRSLNSFNEQVIAVLKENLNRCEDALKKAEQTEPDQNTLNALVRDWQKLRNWFFFLLTSQDYRSPSGKREDTVFQGGLLKVPNFVKYIRSEINTPNFGEPYDRSAVIIQSKAAESFAALSSKYIVMAASKNSVTYTGALEKASEFINTHPQSMCLLTAETPKDLEILASQIEELNTLNPQFEGGIYIRFKGTLPVALKERLAVFLNGKSDIQLLLEEDYDPLDCDKESFRKVTLLHNNSDKLRYQLLQDAASMGYRPDLSDVAKYYYSAGRLEPLLNTEYKTEDSIISWNGNHGLVNNSVDLKERNRDYGVMLDTVMHLKNKLSGMKPFSALDISVKVRLVKEASEIEGDLRSILSRKDAPVKEISAIFHKNFYRIRELLIYTSRLEVNTTNLTPEEIEVRISRLEGSLSLATNSGMTAARAVITTLAETVDTAATTDHYWETDFLIENLFSHNPHYSNTKVKTENRLTKIPFNATEKEIEKMVDGLLETNPGTKGGQLLCVDKSIAPFFYTRTFNLAHLCQCLDMESYRIEKPIYLVVDNTLDFASVNPQTLFPNGIPENVFLIFTPSMAKLHQLGMDMVTGGIIHIHSNPADAEKARALHARLKDLISRENTGQDPYKSALLDNVFYQRFENNTMKNYLDFMVRKRQRNTKALISALETSLGEYLENDASMDGMFNYKNPKTGQNALTVTDAQGKEHLVKFSFHYDPKSCIHSFFKVEEDNTDKYVAGPVFEEMKRRIFKRASRAGIHLADGTSWGFHITRMDWYMHTMRIAIGLEHNKTLSRLGNIISSVIKELLLYPKDFLNGVEVEPMTPEFLNKNSENIMSLDREIPHDPQNPTPFEYYTKEEPGKWKYSFVIKDNEKLAGMVLAYEKVVDGEKVVYISKASVAAEYRSRGFFRRMNLHLKDLARQDGFSRVVLETSASQKNEGVITAYEKCGFEVYDTTVEKLPDGWPLIKVLMRLPVERSDLALPSGHFEPVKPEVYQQMYDWSA